MKCLVALLLALVLSGVAVRAIEPAAFPDNGTWKLTSGVLGGKPLPPEVLKTISLKISGRDYEVDFEGDPQPDKGTFTDDPNAVPKRLTITSTTSEGKVLRAIYERKDGRTLRLCYDTSGADFPKAFESPKDSTMFLVEYVREP